MIEEISTEDALSGAIEVVNGIVAVPKDEHEIRPCLDCTRSGLNGAMAPWGISLPTIIDFLSFLHPTFELGKRDFRHGFHHLTVRQDDRRFLGFRFPGSEKFGRWRAVPFGMSQSLGRF